MTFIFGQLNSDSHISIQVFGTRNAKTSRNMMKYLVNQKCVHRDVPFKRKFACAVAFSNVKIWRENYMTSLLKRKRRKLYLPCVAYQQ